LNGKAPIVQWAFPFLFDVLCGQVHQFEQCHVAGERALGLGHLAHLAMEALHGNCSIDDLPDGFGVLEVL